MDLENVRLKRDKLDRRRSTFIWQCLRRSTVSLSRWSSTSIHSVARIYWNKWIMKDGSDDYILKVVFLIIGDMQSSI